MTPSWLHLARSGSQSQGMIWFILPTHTVYNKNPYCIAKTHSIAKTHFYAHTDSSFRNLGILKFHDMHLLQLLGLFMYSHQNRALPSKFDCKFTLQKEIHSYHTRNSHLYRLPLCQTNIKQFSVFHQGPKFYNSLSTEIVNSSSSVSFKKHLRRFSVITINSFYTSVFKY